MRIYKLGHSIVIDAFNFQVRRIAIADARYCIEDVTVHNYVKITDIQKPGVVYYCPLADLKNEANEGFASDNEAHEYLSSFIGGFNTASGGSEAKIFAPLPRDGQFTSVVDYDSGWHEQAGTYLQTEQKGNLVRLLDRYTLDQNNDFNNPDRYTNSVGTQSFDGSDGEIIGYRIDHYYNLGLFYNASLKNNLVNSCSNAHSLTVAGLTGFRVWNDAECQTILDKNLTASGEALTDALEMLFGMSFNETHRTSTKHLAGYSSAYTVYGQGINPANASSLRYVAIRKHYT